MNKKRIGILIALLAVVCFGVKAQSTTSLKLNEVLVVNEQNYQDNYGVHSAWIEIFNTSYATVDLKGCFLTNDKSNPKKYSIPKGDVLTQIKPRQHALFWADGIPSRGTFHINFTLNPSESNYIALYDSDGRTLIDEVTIPAGQIADHSYAREEDGSSKWAVKGFGDHSYVTPSSNNMTIDKNPKIENFRENDSIGIGMAITAMSVVFCGLILLYLSFKFVGNMAVSLSKRNAMKAAGITDSEEADKQNLGTNSADEIAAISMAMHEYLNDAHDLEDMILTINRVKRTYSPWSSKIYTLRQNPRS
ncbi:MAG: lamin tail domain-containing protein [Bacteroidia bacterium]|nr:lamin tail domain-containing protein [Bacteroidia bacterium]